MVEIKSLGDVHKTLKQFMPPATSYGPAVLSLEDMKQLMAAIGDPQDQLKVIHIAGTSGKTSTSYYMASMLHQAGKKVGLTVSPHVDDVNERVQIDLQPLDEKTFCRELSVFLALIEPLTVKPSYFALLIAFAYWEFVRQGVEYAVVEVGMGGLLDATNVVTRPDKLCIITDIGLDHTEFLGSTVEEIASQKAGIIKPYNTVFMYEQDEGIMSVIREVCEQQQAELHEVWPLSAKELPKSLPLFQRRNWYLSLSAYTYLAQRDGLGALSADKLTFSTDTYVPARMEIREYKGKTIVMDGAHNAQKMSTLAHSLKNRFTKQDIAVLFSSVETKGRRTRSAASAVAAFASHVIITAFSGEQDTPKQSVKPAKVAEVFHLQGYDKWEIIETPEQAFEALLQRPEQVLLVTGSFYLLNHIRPLLHKDI